MSRVIEELKELAEEFGILLEKHKRRNKKSQHAGYKAKRLDELDAVWVEFNTKASEVESKITVDDKYNHLKQKAIDVYQNYLDILNKIPSEEAEESESEDNGRKMDSASKLASQQARMDTIERHLGDLATRIDANGMDSITANYAVVKEKKLTEIWHRIELEHETLSDKGTADYQQRFRHLEQEVEEAQVILQGRLQQNVGGKEGVKLSRVTIPKFSGDYFKWVTFRDLFSTMVLTNKQLSNSQKMQMLKTNLSGEAEALIGDLTISEVNLDCAWDRLVHRYENNKVVVYKLLGNLMNQSMAKNDAKALKKLLDSTDQTILALQNLGRPTAHWDDWIVLCLSQKFPEETQREWEKHAGGFDNLPTWNHLKMFMEEQYRILERIETSHKPGQRGSIKTYQTSFNSTNCAVCDETHQLFSCEKWKKMEIKDRWTVAKRNKLCFSCLRKHEDKLSCDKRKPCKKCDKKHSTWLHENQKSGEVVVLHSSITPKEVLLSTAMVQITTQDGKRWNLRALIDSGSQGSMMTKRAAEIMDLPMRNADRTITGLGGMAAGQTKRTTVKLSATFDTTWDTEVEVYILKNLTKMLPDQDYDPREWKHLKGLTWADPNFYKRGHVDILLGMDVIVEIMKSRFVKGPEGQPLAQNTKLGWIMSGKIDRQWQSNEVRCLINTTDEEEKDDQLDLARFWEIEELHPERMITAEEQECETFYQQTIKKDTDGKYIAKIPFKKEMGPENLGNSRGQCMARFLQLEKRLATDAKLKEEYTKVINEYLTLGHMVEVSKLAPEQKLYYIPHHAVVKPDSLTTKLRVVFDASAKTSTGKSLNDCMHVGARQQADLFEILMRWRKNEIVFKADMEKMYRQVKLDKEDQRYHTILWRNQPATPIKEYQLTTATFGTAAAPFLATRTLRQIADDTKDKYQLAHRIIKDDFYVDDLISGSSNIEVALKEKDELIAALQTGGMTLRKWTSNNEQFLSTIPVEQTEKMLQSVGTDETKTLGIRWNPATDSFSFEVKWMSEERMTTRRNLLSESSKLYDPLGWLAPIMIKAKMIMQKAYDKEIGWDDTLPETITEAWSQFKKELPAITALKIPRWIQLTEKMEKIALVGFCDASEQGYAAVVYTWIQENGETKVTMLASKTRVAPIKSKLTIPQLELCGAVLLSNLMARTKKALQINNIPTYAWTDSMITLGWIRAGPERWKTFVANRVAEINNNNLTAWGYVKSEDNPADCASRGIMPQELVGNKLWFNGPTWLQTSPETWEGSNMDIPTPKLEEKSIAVHLAVVTKDSTWNRFSSWNRLSRVIAYCRRVIHRKKGSLTASEIQTAKEVIIRRCQEETFAAEIECLKRKTSVPKQSKIFSLDPFLDEYGTIRVGGRLENAELPFEEKHPIILPNGHWVTKLIHRHSHHETLHGGPQLVMNLMRKRFWTIQGKRMAKDAYSQCVTCRRFAGHNQQQKMGNLPAVRVNPGRSFLHTGVDYAGPIQVKTSSLRSSKVESGYIALFVCMATKAIHLELVSSGTTTAFLAAFDRFVSRRGLPNTMYSDNGTNFVGAANKFQRDWLKIQNEALAEKVACRGVEWEFIPPAAPHFGGLWERGVRSMKEHLKKTLGTASLTFEEYGTLLSKVEACLNSRPICAMNADIDSLDVLTPGHFLIGNALLAPPEPNKLDTMITRNKRWENVQKLSRQIWDKWSEEYLKTLQQRKKWQQDAPNLEKGDMVAVKDENLPPQKWLLGRITETHAGTDGKVRVATLKVRTGTPPTVSNMTRPIVKLCPLWTKNDEAQEAVPVIQEPMKVKTGPEHKTRPMKDKRIGQKTYALRSRRNLNPIVTLIALFGFALICSASSEPIKVTPFQQNAGIYFENLGRANLARSHWNLVTYIEMTQYRLELKYIQDAVTKLEKMCMKRMPAEQDPNCAGVVNMLKERLTTIEGMNQLLQENKLHGFRTKRGAFDGVGWLGHKLFGIMDAEHAQALEADVTESKTNLKHVMELMKKQTNTVELTSNLMKIVQVEGVKNYQNLAKAIDSLNNATDQSNQHEQILAWTMYTSLWLDRLEKLQREIIHLLTDLQQGHVSSYLFTPKKLREQLALINDYIPAGSKLPVDPQHDMKSFYELIRGSIRVTEKLVLIEMKIPLISTHEFQMFHIIPVPTKYQDKRVSIQVDSEYLLMTLQKDIFYQLSEKELEKCMKPSTGMTICGITKAWNTAQSSKSKCERDLLARQSMLSSSCKVTVSPDEDFWQQLSNENRWIYDLKQERTLNIVCNNEVSTNTLTGSGIIELESGCEASYDGNTLIATSNIYTDGFIDFQPAMQLSDVVKKGSMNLELIDTDHKEQFDHITSELEEMKTQSKLEHQSHKTHYTTGISGLAIVLTMITLWRTKNWWIWKLCKQMTKAVRPIESTNHQQENNDVELGSVNRAAIENGDTIGRSDDKPTFSAIEQLELEK